MRRDRKNASVPGLLLALGVLLLAASPLPGQTRTSAGEAGMDCFGIIVGRKASTDGYVYLGHNEDQSGEQMLNIYNVPATPQRLSYLWFEFPGQKTGDSFVNEWGVAVTSDHCPSKETMEGAVAHDRRFRRIVGDSRSGGPVLYEVRVAVAQKARSAREGVKIIGEMVERYGYADDGRSYLVADRGEGWVVAVVRGRHWVAQRVPDDEIMTIPNYYVIGEVDLADTANFLGSKDLIKYARKRGWYNPRRDGAFRFRLAYGTPASLEHPHNLERHRLAQETFFGDAILGPDAPFSRKPVHPFHRRHLSQLLTEPPIRNDRTVLTNIFTMNPAFPPQKGTVIWVGYPGQSAADQSQWTVHTRVPESCHRYATAEEAMEKHFTDVGHFRQRWPGHFYWHYTDPSINQEVIPHDYTVYVPKQPRLEADRDITKRGDTFNDHFHVLEDPARGLLYAFWTQGSWEAANDEHVVFSKSADGGKTWTDPVTLAGSETLADPKPVAAWQQPMLSRSGRLYCLWNQETTVKKHLCGIMQGRYSDDAGETWSEIGTVPFPIRFSSDPDDPTVPPSWCMWQRPLRFGEGGRYLAGCSRYSYKTQGRESSKVEFWQYDNIDDDPQIEDIRISFFNTEDESFDAATVETDEHFTGREVPSVEEACIVGLPDGRLFAVMRTSIGHPIWSVSADQGRHWSRPEVLRERDGGPAILQPRSPCPIYDVEGPEARSGRYALFVHDTFDFNGMTSYQNRGPVYRRDGRFVPGAHQPFWFEGKPVLFSPRDTGNSFYTSSTALDGVPVLWFGDMKFYLFGKIL